MSYQILATGAESSLNVVFQKKKESRASIKGVIAIDACMAPAQHVQSTPQGDWAPRVA